MPARQPARTQPAATPPQMARQPQVPMQSQTNPRLRAPTSPQMAAHLRATMPSQMKRLQAAMPPQTSR
jgi:hypothetical protein